MDYVFVLEDDPVYRRQLEESIKTIPGKLEVRFFDSLAGFADQIKAVMAGGAKAFSAEANDPVKVALVICKLEFIGPNRLGLLAKTREFFIRRGLCTAEDPTHFVLTAFDDPQFHIENYKKAILSNLIFKPFDRMMLDQHLQMAYDGGKAKSSTGMAVQKTKALVEMLKSVDVTTMSEIGFKSISNRAFETGSVNKYYGKDFESDRHLSVMARLISCKPMNDHEFILDFHFFALDATQITNMRKRIRAKDKFSTRLALPPSGGRAGLPEGHTANPLFVLIEPDEEYAKSLSGTLQRKISGSQVVVFKTKKEMEDDVNSTKSSKLALSTPLTHLEVSKDLTVPKVEPEGATLFGEPLLMTSLHKYLDKESGQNLGLWMMGPQPEYKLRLKHLGETAVLLIKKNPGGPLSATEIVGKERETFLLPFRQLKKPVTALFVSHKEVDVENIQTWQSFLAGVKDELAPEAAVFMIATREFTDNEERKIGVSFTDVFFYPLDRIYILQKLIHLIPGLKILEDPVTVSDKNIPQVIRSANPVELEEISEAMIVIHYYRTLEADEYRDFILWQPYEITAPELAARVFKIEEEDDDKNPARIRFVFFGVKDHQAKGVRLWSLNNYISSKDKGNG